MDLRSLIESDLEDTLEGDFGLPVTLISPSGESETVMGQVAYDTRKYDPVTGSEMIIDLPVVTVRRSSLSTIPALCAFISKTPCGQTISQVPHPVQAS